MARQSDVIDKNGENVSKEQRLRGLRAHSEELNRIVRESLSEALLQLMVRKPYPSISVTELCSRAGVSRMAFYCNFATKDEILKNIVVSLQKELTDRIGSPFRKPVTKQWYVGMFGLVQEHADVLKLIFGAGFMNKYLQYVNGIVLRHKDMQEGEIYLRLLWCGAIVNIMQYWLEKDMAIPADVLAEFCSKYLVSFNEATCVINDYSPAAEPTKKEQNDGDTF